MTEKYFDNNILIKHDKETDEPLAFLMDREIAFQHIAGLAVTGDIDLLHDEYVINTLRNYVETGSLRSILEIFTRYSTIGQGSEISCIEYKNKEYIQVKEV